MAEVPILMGGSSLAGMACAIRLRQLGHDVCVLEKSVFPRPKLCGEFLGPDAIACLHQLGVLARIQPHAFGPVEHTYFFNRHGQSLNIQHAWISRKYPYGLAIPRETLDHLLLQYARHLGINIFEGRRILSPIERHSDRFIVRAEVKLPSSQHETETYLTPFFLDATGRSGKLIVPSDSTPENRSRANQTQTPVRQPWVGIQCHVTVPEHALGSALHMFLFPGGYGGIQPLSGHRANCCMLLEASLAKATAKHLHTDFNAVITSTIGQNPVARVLLETATPEDSFATTADVHLPKSRWKVRTQPIIRLGDAMVNLDPFTGSGMAHALQTGLLAADIVHAGLQRGSDYPTLCHDYQHAYQRRFGLRLRLLSRFRPLLASSGLQRALWPILPPFLPLLASTFR
jgi:flavin-dependent dehydrogenase